MPKKKVEITKLNFEEALSMLENIIKKMEMEELHLEESLICFQEGMELNAHCRRLLSEAELRVEKLLQSGKWEKYDEPL